MNSFKNIFVKTLIILFVICAALLCSVSYFTSKNRFNLDSPMQDVEYKKAIINSSHKKFYTLEALRPLLGPEELTEFIKKNDANPEIFISSEKNIKSGKFHANLHMHTLNSDGSMSVKELLDKAQSYGEQLPDGEFMYVAISDHNTVLGGRELVRVLEQNKGKYTRVKAVAAIEIFTEFHDSKYTKEPVKIHVLTWCINPYDKYLNKEFYKKDLNEKYNRPYPDRDFDNVISTMKNYGIVGVAHPASYTGNIGAKKYDYIEEMFDRYKHLVNSEKPLFTEAYYQAYKSDNPNMPEDAKLGADGEKYLDFISKKAAEKGIIRTGSQDTHGTSLFKR